MREPAVSASMRLRDAFTRPPEPHDLEAPAVVRRRRVVVAATLVVGTAMLGATIATPSGSVSFAALGLLTALTWIVGALVSGPVPGGRGGQASLAGVEFVSAILLGALLFGAFFFAKLAADRLPVLGASVAGVLAHADAGPRGLVLVVALVNGLGEELFFRGALYSASGKNHPAVWATAIYGLVTVATLKLALVGAALALGSVLCVQRRATGGVRAPILTHLTWSTLILFLLPR